MELSQRLNTKNHYGRSLLFGRCGRCQPLIDNLEPRLYVLRSVVLNLHIKIGDKCPRRRRHRAVVLSRPNKSKGCRA